MLNDHTVLVNPLYDISLERNVFSYPTQFKDGPRAHAPTLRNIRDEIEQSFHNPLKYKSLYLHFKYSGYTRLKRAGNRELICRFSQLLVNHYNIHTDELYNSPKYEQIALYLNVSIRRVQRLFKLFKSLGWITIIRKNIRRMGEVVGISAKKILNKEFFIQALSYDSWKKVEQYKKSAKKKSHKADKIDSERQQTNIGILGRVISKLGQSKPRKAVFDSIATSSDQLPKDLKSIMERLSSRFKPPS